MYRQAFLYPGTVFSPVFRHIELSEMLAERDIRENLRHVWQEEAFPFISLCLNLPGSLKRSSLSDFFFCGAEKALSTALTNMGARIRRFERRSADAGLSAHFLLESISAESAKRLAIKLEEQLAAGRLLDIDVFAENGQKLSGRNIRGPRTCLLCGEDAFICARSRAHNTEELRAKAFAMIRDQLLRFYEEELRFKALKAMLREIAASPKPGLVDRKNNGSHKDMDFYLFSDSSIELFEQLGKMSKLSCELVSTGRAWDEGAVKQLHECGKEAEQALLRANDGVNTQNGLFFAFSLMIPSAMKLFEERLRHAESNSGNLRLPQAEEIGEESAVLAGKVCGDYISQQNGKLKGARASAFSAYRLICKEAAPLLLRLRGEGFSRDVSSLRVLLFLMARTEDSNLIRRGGPSSLLWVQAKAKELESMFQRMKADQENEFLDHMRSFDEEMQKRHLSPGGSADLLALSWFLAEIDRKSDL